MIEMLIQPYKIHPMIKYHTNYLSNVITFFSFYHLFVLYLETSLSSIVPPQLKDQSKYFDQIFQGIHTTNIAQIILNLDINGSAASKLNRVKDNLDGIANFTYGQVQFIYFTAILAIVKPKQGQIFWDLGCGTGKPIFIAGLVYPCLKSVNGVQFLQKLVELGQKAVKKFNQKYSKGPMASIIKGDIKEVDWLDADIVYTSSVCFTNQLLDAIFKRACLLKKGARLISLRQFGKQYESYDEFMKYYMLIEQQVQAKMSWGNTQCYIYEKFI